MRVNRYAAATFLAMAAFAAAVQAAGPNTSDRGSAMSGMSHKGMMDMSHDSMMQMCNDMMSDSPMSDAGGMRMRLMREGTSTVPYGAAFFNKANGGVSPP